MKLLKILTGALMEAQMLKEIDTLFKDRIFLSVLDITQLLGCSENVVYNWMKRSDPARRPPRIKVGKDIKFPRGAFVQWLVKEQG